MVGAPGSRECAANIAIMKGLFEQTGLPTEPEKDEGPATSIGLLGLELDSERLEIRLPEDKLSRLRSALEAWRGKKVCRKKDLLSLIGSLSHACKAVKAGRAFLRRLIDLSMTARHLDRFIRLGNGARSDIE